ncbi:MAG: 7-cyano-7-deazaguanine synthase QueC [Deltaproteobacteria bacterium]|nr:7-cyano-7-deazaguanine synthase QueC [Deltaproteobacteria bacterium]
MKNTKQRAVVLLSGGLDSTTVLAIAAKEGYACYCLSFSYGQRQVVELVRARETAKRYGASDHLVLDLGLDRIGGSALTSELAVPKSDGLAAGLADENDIPVTYVPGRNTIFLSYAMAWAEVVGAFAIFIGVNAMDYSGYPDCRPEYLEAFSHLARLATRAGVTGSSLTIHAPLLTLSKSEIIRQGTALGVDYGKTHSCYDPDKSGAACGRCEACQLRLKGFAEAGLPDPAIYQSGRG